MSWGIRIAVLYLAFVGMMVTLVFLSMRQDVDLVSADYYKRELQYQEQLDRMNNSNALETVPQVSVNETSVVVVFPAGVKSISGQANIYRPSDPKKDFTVPLENVSGTMEIPREKFSYGLYQLQLSWSADGQDYYNEFPVTIP
jgi:hypothetical protein